ncbi:hypothetical protein [Serratia marcescens]|uniref:hypothetical protein n=1 Tax=Serratia marcescens TaxID=615 RepID=UPI003982E7F3
MDIRLFHEAFSSKKANLQFVKATKSDDDIGTVLRIHLYLERVLEAWTACATENNKIFDGKININFVTKLQIAKNFGMPNDISSAIEEINRIRNKFSHNIENDEITEQNISKLESILQTTQYHEMSPLLVDSIVILQGREIAYKDMSLKLKLCAICMHIISNLNFFTLKECNIDYKI